MERGELCDGPAGGNHRLRLSAGHQGALRRLWPEAGLQPLPPGAGGPGPPGDQAGGYHFLRLRPGKAAGLHHHRHFVLCLLLHLKVPLHALGVRLRGRDQRDPLLRPLPGGHPQHLPDSAGLPPPGAVFRDIRPGPPAAGRQRHRPQDSGKHHRPFQLVGHHRDFGGGRLLRRGGHVLRRAGVRLPQQPHQLLRGRPAAEKGPLPGLWGVCRRRGLWAPAGISAGPFRSGSSGRASRGRARPCGFSAPGGRGKKIREKFVKTIAIVFPVVYNTALGPPGDRSVPGLYS